MGPIDCPDDYIVIGGNRLCGSRFNDGSEPAMTENTKLIGTFYIIDSLLYKLKDSIIIVYRFHKDYKSFVLTI